MIQLVDKGMSSVAESHSLLSIIYSRKGEILQSRTQYELAAEEMEISELRYCDLFWIQREQAELYIAEKSWKEAWLTYEMLYKFGIEKKFIWHSNLVLLNWATANLMHDEPEDIIKAKEMLD